MRADNLWGLAQKLLADNRNGDAELFHNLAETAGGRVELIVSTGQVSPPGFAYDQDEDEWVLVLQGRAVLDVAGERKELGAGDCLFLPRGLKHRVLFTSCEPACLWLAVFWC